MNGSTVIEGMPAATPRSADEQRIAVERGVQRRALRALRERRGA
jgi:hypothetical protein